MKNNVLDFLCLIWLIAGVESATKEEERREAVIRIISDGEKSVDEVYASLRYNITPMERNGNVYTKLHRYFEDTMKEEGVNCCCDDARFDKTFSVVDIFTLANRHSDNPSPVTDNKMLLWRGIIAEDWVKTLTSGIKIVPKEKPDNFGPGVYFADSSGKSSCYMKTTENNMAGVLLLGEVSLGGVEVLSSRDPTYNSNKLPADKSSVKALGAMTPDSSTFWKLGNVLVPSGKLQPTGVVYPKGDTLEYNERKRTCW